MKYAGSVFLGRTERVVSHLKLQAIKILDVHKVKRPIQSKEESLNRPTRANLKNKQTKEQEVKIESQRTKKEVTEIKMRRSKN